MSYFSQNHRTVFEVYKSLLCCLVIPSLTLKFLMEVRNFCRCHCVKFWYVWCDLCMIEVFGSQIRCIVITINLFHLNNFIFFRSCCMHSWTSMWQVLPPMLQLQDRSINPLFSNLSIMGNSTLSSLVCMSWYTKSISCAHDLAAYHLASITDRVMTFWVELLAIIGELFTKTCVPDTLFLLSGLVA